MFRIDLKRVYLRNFMFCDLLDVHHYSINPNIGPNAGWAPHRNIEETRSVLLEFTRNRDLFFELIKKNQIAVVIDALNENKDT